MNWQARAACRPGTGVDPQLFDVELDDVQETDEARAARHTLAKLSCTSCPVSVPCYRMGGAFGTEGIYGGTLFQIVRSEDELR